MPVGPAHYNEINAVKLSTITIKQNFLVIDRVI